MKKFLGIGVVFLGFFLVSCASIQNQAAYDKTAREHEFGYYFPSSTGTLAFNDIDSAYDFLNEATEKFRQAGLKRRAQGLSGIVNGPYPETGENKVEAGYFIFAYGTSGVNVISEESGIAEIENILKDSIGSYLGFVVFYENRAVVISNYYLKDRYVYNSNSQPNYIEYNGNSYEANYPIGWTMDRAFRYLKEGK
jgi:hypothetical protein